jgi:hypothetical protein
MLLADCNAGPHMGFSVMQFSLPCGHGATRKLTVHDISELQFRRYKRALAGTMDSPGAPAKHLTIARFLRTGVGWRGSRGRASTSFTASGEGPIRRLSSIQQRRLLENGGEFSAQRA